MLRIMDAENKQYYAKWGSALSYPITYVMNDTVTSPQVRSPRILTRSRIMYNLRRGYMGSWSLNG